MISETLSIREFINTFNNQKVCENYLEEIRFKELVYCPYCGWDKVYPYKSKNPSVKWYRCAEEKWCGKKFNVKNRTVFQATRLGLHQWFVLLYWFAINKKSLSSRQTSRNMGISLTAGWQTMNKIQRLCKEPNHLILEGVVEIDECFLARTSKWTRWGSISTRKEPILGMIERGSGKFVIKLINSRTKYNLEKIILQYVKAGSTIYTDCHGGYSSLNKHYQHESINHTAGVWSRGIVHTNGIESIWGNLKRNIRGAHGHISAKHVQLYCDEFAYKHNRKHWNPMKIFNDLLLRGMKMTPMPLIKESK